MHQSPRTQPACRHDTHLTAIAACCMLQAPSAALPEALTEQLYTLWVCAAVHEPAALVSEGPACWLVLRDQVLPQRYSRFTDVSDTWPGLPHTMSEAQLTAVR
jgi:hypothetical protein